MTALQCSKGHTFSTVGAVPKKCPVVNLKTDRPCTGTVVQPQAATPSYEKCEGTGQAEVPSKDRRSKKPTCPVCGKRVEPTLNHKVRSHKSKATVNA